MDELLPRFIFRFALQLQFKLRRIIYMRSRLRRHNIWQSARICKSGRERHKQRPASLGVMTKEEARKERVNSGGKLDGDLCCDIDFSRVPGRFTTPGAV